MAPNLWYIMATYLVTWKGMLFTFFIVIKICVNFFWVHFSSFQRIIIFIYFFIFMFSYKLVLTFNNSIDVLILIVVSNRYLILGLCGLKKLILCLIDRYPKLKILLDI